MSKTYNPLIGGCLISGLNNKKGGRENMVKETVRLGLLVCLLLLFVPGGLQAADKDAKGSKDHPLFSRMPEYHIHSYDYNDFDRHEFYLKDGKKEVVEGKTTHIVYAVNKGAPRSSEIEIVRNHQNAVAAVGGRTISETRGGKASVMQLTRDGAEYWAEVKSSASGGQYIVHVVEREAMAQSVTSEAIRNAIDKDGFVTIDVHFDTDKSLIKPESNPLLDQLAAMMQKSPKLNIAVEGHTDNVGDSKRNKALSEARAKSVVDALVQRGIAPERLSAEGFGQERPVADNRSEEGRAKNRRVELVKK